MRGPPAMHVALLVICCLWFHAQPTAANNKCEKYANANCGRGNDKCIALYLHKCAGGANMGGGISVLAQATSLGTGRDGSDTQGERGGEWRGRWSESDGSGDDRGDDLRSEVSDRRQLLEEEQLLEIANRQHRTSPSPLGSSLRKTLRRVNVRVDEEDDKEEDEEVEAEPTRRNDTDTDRRYSIRYTLTMMRKILDNIERRVDSVNKARGYDDDAGNDFYLPQKRPADQ